MAGGFAVYEVLVRESPAFTLTHCCAHTLRHFGDIAEQWPVACREIAGLIGELYEIERMVPGPFPGDDTTQTLRRRLRPERSRPVLDRIWQWATVQVGLPQNDFGKAVRYMLERWDGLTRFVDNPQVPLDNNSIERALRGPVVGRKNHHGSRSLVALRLPPSSTLSARPQSWLELIPTRIYSTPSMRLSPVLASSRIRKIS